MIKDHSASS